MRGSCGVGRGAVREDARRCRGFARRREACVDFSQMRRKKAGWSPAEVRGKRRKRREGSNAVGEAGIRAGNRSRTGAGLRGGVGTEAGGKSEGAESRGRRGGGEDADAACCGERRTACGLPGGWVDGVGGTPLNLRRA